jgi:hypothetical protein
MIVSFATVPVALLSREFGEATFGDVPHLARLLG